MDKNDQNGAASAVRSLDELDGAVKITTPGIWMVLLACFALLAGIFAWGYFGAVSSGVSASGIVKDGLLYLFYTGNVEEDGDYDYVTAGRGTLTRTTSTRC